MAKVRINGIFAGADGALVILDAQRVVAERILELQDHGGILPGATEAEDFDARRVALGMTGGEFGCEDGEALRLARRQFGEDGVSADRLRVEGRGGVAPDEFAGGYRHQKHGCDGPTVRTAQDDQQCDEHSAERQGFAERDQRASDMSLRDREGEGRSDDQGHGDRDARREAIGRPARQIAKGLRQTVHHIAMDEVARAEGEGDVEQERRIGRTAVRATRPAASRRRA